MRNLQYIARMLAVAAVLAAAPGACAQDAASLHGKWESTRTSRGGIGPSIAFEEGGNCAADVGVIADGTYRVEDGILIRMMPDSPEELPTPYTVSDTELCYWVEGLADTMRLTRTETSVARSGVTGEWTYMHSTGKQAWETFTDDGRFLFRLPLSSSTGQYSVEGEVLRIEGGMMAGEYRWSVDGEQLSLASPDGEGEPRVFKRAASE